MADPNVFTLRWGIMATGHVAGLFTRDLLTNPSTRGVSDVQHKIVAIASSTSLQKATSCRDDIQAPSDVTLYASYAELVEDPDVDIVYVATPVSHHFRDAMMAIGAGKSVLCEKALTVTAAQARILVAAARARNVFLLEAVWTRFFPLSVRVRSLVKNGAIGTVHRVIADTSLDIHLPAPGDAPDPNNKLHRLLKLDLAGGATLDLGIYSLTWIMQSPTGVDETSTFILKFPNQNAMGVGMTSLRIASGVDFDFTAGPPIRIQGSLGEIQVYGPSFKPNKIRIITKDGSGPAKVVTEEFVVPKDPERNGWGHGLFWEADECARCIRDGRLESDILPLRESVLMMEMMEEVLKEGGVMFPEGITGEDLI